MSQDNHSTDTTSPGHPLHARRQEKLANVMREIQEQGLTFHEFVVGAVTSTSASIRLSTTKWINSLSSVSNERYGPSIMVQEVVAAVRNRAPRDRSEAFDVLLARLAAPVYLREVDSAVTDQWLHLPPSLGVVEGIKQDDAITLDLRKIKSHYELKMPATMCLIGGMVQNKARERPKTSVGGLQVSQPDLPGPESEDEEGVRGVSEEVEDALSPKDVKIVTAVSAILSARSPRPNRFQMTVAVMCSLLRVPQLVMRFLNACGISLSARTAHRAMESISSQSIFQARRLIETHPCRTVLLFDNINIYVKHSLQRIITSNVSIALTSRTLFTLPSQCTPLQLDDVRRIAALDRNMMTMETITGDDRFMDDAAQWHVAAALIPILTITEDRRSKLKAALRRRLRKRTINRLETEKTKIVPLKIMKENEGTVEGTKRVLEVTMESFKLDKDAPDPFLVAGDLLTVLNVFAARHAASWEKNTLDQLANVYAVAGPWHLLLNWVYGMFRTYGHCDAGTSLERMRKILGRGKTELDMKRPQFDEGWRLLYHVWTGKLVSALEHTLKAEGIDLKDWNPSSRDFFTCVDRLVVGHLSQAAVQEAQRAKDVPRATSVLFLRDCVLGLEYRQATKAGDLGRMAEAEKFLCLSFYGTGQTKYGSLLMDRALIDKHLPELSQTLRAAQVVNVHGRDDGWQGSDHFQELLNGRIKSYDFDHKSDDAVNRIEDRISAFVGLGEELVDEMQECLGWNSRRRKKKEAIPEEDVQLLSADTKAHDLNAARGSGSNKTLRETALDEITSKKRSAAEQAQLVWEATSNLSAVNDCISKGYEYLVVNGLARFKDKQSDLQTRDRDVFDMATGRGSPTPREDGNDGNQEGETDGDFPDDEAVRLAEQEIVGEDKLGNDDEGSGSEDEDSDSN